MPVYLACCAIARDMTEVISGTEIHYRILGEGAKKVLLLHGWGCDMSMMQPVADAFVPTHQVLLIDFPGHGLSGRPPEPWGVAEYAQCLKTLLEHTGFTPCSVIAHSFGCRIAAWLSVYSPELFDRIVFTGAAGIRPRPTKESEKRSSRYQRLKGYGEKIRKVPGLGKAADKWQETLRRKYGSRDYNALDREMQKTFVKVISEDLTDLYGQFSQSTLLIWGDEDTETPLWMGKEMEARIPDAGLVILEGGSHFAYLEQIRRFNTIALHFLKEEE